MLTISAAFTAAAVSLLVSPGATNHQLAALRVAIPAVPAATPVCHEPPQLGDPAREHTVSDISWFQGTLEEAFTRHPRKDHRPLLHF
jgi:hypothetical protein